MSVAASAGAGGAARSSLSEPPLVTLIEPVLGLANLEKVIRDIIAALTTQQRATAALSKASDSGARVDALERSLAERDSIIEQLRKQQADNQALLRDLKSGLDGANARIDGLTKASNSHDTAINSLNDSTAAHQSLTQTMLANQAKEIEQLKRRIATAPTPGASGDAGKDGLSAAEAQKLRDAMDALRSRFDRLNDEVSDLRSAVNANAAAAGNKRGSGGGIDATGLGNLLRRDEFDRYAKVTDQRLASLERDRDAANENIKLLAEQSKKNGVVSNTDSKGSLSLSLDDKNQIDSNRRAIGELSKRVERLESNDRDRLSPLTGPTPAVASGVRPSLTNLLPVPARSISDARGSVSSADSTTTGGLTNQLLNDDHDLLAKTVYLVKKVVDDCKHNSDEIKDLRGTVDHLENAINKLNQSRDRDRDEYKSLIAALNHKLATHIDAQKLANGAASAKSPINETKTADEPVTGGGKPANSSYQSSTAGLEDDARIALLREYCADQFSKLWERWQMYEKSLNEIGDRLNRLIASADFDEARGGGYVRLATQGFVDERVNDLANRIKALDASFARNLKTELKKFERDVIVYVEHSRNDHVHGSGDAAAAGKIHFRCLSCDQLTPTVHGPATPAYQAAVTQPKPPVMDAAPGTMLVEKGDDLFIVGRDGQVYKGRTESTVLFTPPASHTRPAKFSVGYFDSRQTRIAAPAVPPPVMHHGGATLPLAALPAPNTTVQYVAPGMGGAPLSPNSQQQQQQLMPPPSQYGGNNLSQSQQLLTAAYQQQQTTTTTTSSGGGQPIRPLTAPLAGTSGSGLPPVGMPSPRTVAGAAGVQPQSSPRTQTAPSSQQVNSRPPSRAGSTTGSGSGSARPGSASTGRPGTASRKK